MSEAVLQALVDVQRILHEAGWDRLGPPDHAALDAGTLEAMRQAYGTILQRKHFDILQQTLGERRPLPEAALALGLSEGEAEALFYEALNRLNAFVGVSEEHGLVAGPRTNGASSGR